MARMTLSQKQQRVLVFLTGSLHEEIVFQLAPSGFDLGVWKQGWSLLERTVLGRAMPRLEPDTVLHRLERLERRWFPILEIVLRAHFPEIHAWVFAGYTRQPGPVRALHVSLVAERLTALAASEGPGQRAAMELLAQRGVTAEVRAEIGATLRELEHPMGDPAPPPRPPSDWRDAEAALWKWYVEWSTIVRATISSPVLLRRLGFGLARRRKSKGSGEVGPAGG